VKRAQGSAEQIFHRFGGKLVDDFSENAAKGQKKLQLCKNT
jgi:hypothetical protein